MAVVARTDTREILREILPELRGRGVVALEWREGEDWAGDPAVWVWVVLPPDAEERGSWAFDNREAIGERIVQAFLDRGRTDVWVYVHFRLESEDRSRDDLEVLEAA